MITDNKIALQTSQNPFHLYIIYLLVIHLTF